jgi:hypothetical protein
LRDRAHAGVLCTFSTRTSATAAEPEFVNVYGAKNRFQGTNSASLFSLLIPGLLKRFTNTGSGFARSCSWAAPDQGKRYGPSGRAAWTAHQRTKLTCAWSLSSSQPGVPPCWVISLASASWCLLAMSQSLQVFLTYMHSNSCTFRMFYLATGTVRINILN